MKKVQECKRIFEFEGTKLELDIEYMEEVIDLVEDDKRKLKITIEEVA